MFCVQFVEERGQGGTRPGVGQDGIPALSRKLTGTQRGNVGHELAAGLGRQFGNGLFDLL